MALEDGIRLKMIRSVVNKNQKEFSELLELNQATYSKYETGNLDIPDSIKKKLVFQFGISLNWLLTGQGDMFTNNTGPTVDQAENARVEELEKKIDALEKLLERKDLKIDDLKKDIEALDNIISTLDGTTPIGEKYSRVLESFIRIRTKLT